MENKGLGKRDKTHKLIIETAIKLFIEKKSSNVSLDEVADAADIARRTLFYHFKNKETLVMEITRPIFSNGIDFLSKIELQEKVETTDIINLCLFLWKKHGRSLNLLYNIDFENFNSLETIHKQYLTKYMDIFFRIEDFPSDLLNSRKETASIIFRCFVPILSKIDKMDNYETRFINIILGIIKGMSLS